MTSRADGDPRRLTYDIVDVFTDRAFAGNPLAVVHGADDLHTDQLQALAREFNLSETAFPMQPSDADAAAGATYALRIFTPLVELPYAGHPSVGTAWLLREKGIIGDGAVVQSCGEGLLPLELAPGGGPVRLTGGRPQWGEAADPTDALAAVGLTAADLDPVAPPRWATVGIGYLVLPVRADALARCQPDVGILRTAFAHPASVSTGVYVVSWDPQACEVRSRMFAGDLGIPEDPATGSAVGSTSVWLAASGLVPEGATTYRVVQGVEMGRRSVITAGVTVSDGEPVATWIEGTAVHVASGSISVPAATVEG